MVDGGPWGGDGGLGGGHVHRRGGEWVARRWDGAVHCGYHGLDALRHVGLREDDVLAIQILRFYRRVIHVGQGWVKGEDDKINARIGKPWAWGWGKAGAYGSRCG